MTAWEWVQIRGAELLAAAATAGLLVGGVWVGIPFLRERIAEVFLYSFCCVTATVVHTVWDLAMRCGAWLVFTAGATAAPRVMPKVVATPGRLSPGHS
jgi:hypothetical protein